uniref:Uncharacterized protein n=1 Tax=Cucumis melo TaxID=3656 RepID=A0A9I9EHB5_CUCME
SSHVTTLGIHVTCEALIWEKGVLLKESLAGELFRISKHKTSCEEGCKRMKSEAKRNGPRPKEKGVSENVEHSNRLQEKALSVERLVEGTARREEKVESREGRSLRKDCSETPVEIPSNSCDAGRSLRAVTSYLVFKELVVRTSLLNAQNSVQREGKCIPRGFPDAVTRRREIPQNASGKGEFPTLIKPLFPTFHAASGKTPIPDAAPDALCMASGKAPFPDVFLPTPSWCVGKDCFPDASPDALLMASGKPLFPTFFMPT